MAFNWKSPAPSRQNPDVKVSKSGATQCKSCGGTDFDDFCESGDRACAACGTVLQENGIVSTVQFSESGGSSNVVGQFVSGDKGRPSGGGANRGRGRFGHSRDSREMTIQNGKKKIIQVFLPLASDRFISLTRTCVLYVVGVECIIDVKALVGHVRCSRLTNTRAVASSCPQVKFPR